MTGAKIMCRTCQGKTSHEHLYETQLGDGETESASVHRCNGCGGITVQHKVFDDNGAELSATLYPPRMFRRSPRWINDLPHELPDYLREIYISIQADARRLAAMGIRAALERLMVERNGDKGSFARNLDALEESGDISVAQKETLSVVLDLGSAAIHRGLNPGYEDVVSALDIFELVLQQVFVHRQRVESLRGRIPPRPSRNEGDDD